MKDIVYKELIKSLPDSRIYYAESIQGKKYIIKELLTHSRIARMKKEIEVCTAIKLNYPDFPCAVPQQLSEKVYIQAYLSGTHYLDLRLNGTQKEEIAHQLVSLLSQLRQVSLAMDEQITFEEWREKIRQQSQQSIRIIRGKELLNSALLHSIYDWIATGLATAKFPSKLGLVHNDLNKENILINCSDKSVQVSLIDFERCIIADPLKDISKLIWLFREDKAFGDLFWSAYCCEFGEQDIQLLKVYWCLDMLSHLEQYDYLIKNEGWKAYLDEEIGLVQEIMKEGYKLW